MFSSLERSHCAAGAIVKAPNEEEKDLFMVVFGTLRERAGQPVGAAGVADQVDREVDAVAAPGERRGGEGDPEGGSRGDVLPAFAGADAAVGGHRDHRPAGAAGG